MDRPGYGASRRALNTARGLGWFSIGLGLVQLLMPRDVAQAAGLRRRDGALMRACGARELATGVAILAARNPTPGVWARVVGDALDVAVLGSRLDAGGRRRRSVTGAVAMVAGIAAVDLLCARALSTQQRAHRALRAVDYRHRSGLPKPPDAMRGVARADFEVPRDMRTPEALRPYS